MSDAGLHTPPNGPQDCGSFFLDATGPYRPEQFRIAWTDEPRPSTDEVERIIERFWNTRMEAAQRDGFELFNGPLCRLVDYRESPEALELLIGPTDYRDFVGTNLHNAYLRYTHSQEILANPLGLTCLAISADGYVVLCRRSRKVAFHAEKIHPASGRVRRREGALPDPTADLYEGMLDELGIEGAELGEPTCLGLIRDKQIVQPDLVFNATTELDADEIRRRMLRARCRDHHTAVLVVRDDPSNVVSFLEANLEAMTPVGMGSLLLHGLTCWGGGWFASTRGYLRNLI